MHCRFPSQIYYRAGKENGWERIDGAATCVSAAAGGKHIWVTNGDGEVRSLPDSLARATHRTGLPSPMMPRRAACHRSTTRPTRTPRGNGSTAERPRSPCRRAATTCGCATRATTSSTARAATARGSRSAVPSLVSVCRPTACTSSVSTVAMRSSTRSVVRLAILRHSARLLHPLPPLALGDKWISGCQTPLCLAVSSHKFSSLACLVAGKDATWEKMDGGLKEVHVSSCGAHIWGTNAGGQVYYRAGVHGGWEEKDGNAASICSCGGGWGLGSSPVICANSEGEIYHKTGAFTTPCSISM